MEYNYYGVRTQKIINRLRTNKYLTCNSIEDCEQVIRYEGINNIKSQYINTLKEKHLI